MSRFSLSTCSRAAALCTLFALSLSSCARLHDVRVGAAGAEYWFPKLEGDVRLHSPGLPRVKIDVEDTLDLDDEEGVNFRVAGQIQNFTIDLGYFDLDYSGENRLVQTINFGGQEFTIGTDLSSDLDLTFFSGKVKFGLFEAGPVVFGAIVGMNYLELKSDLRSSTPPISASEELRGVFPVVGTIATFQHELHRGLSVFAEAEISGFYVDDAFDTDGSFFDAAARTGLEYGVLRVGGGYRFLDVDVEDTKNNFDWDVSLGGPFVFAEIAF